MRAALLFVPGSFALLVACKETPKPTKPPEPSAAVQEVKAAPREQPAQVDTPDGATRHFDGDHFALDLASTGCKVNAECTLTIQLAVHGEYHVNKEYPYRFVAASTPGVDYLGKEKEKPTQFTREAGDFVAQGEKAGTMTVKFKPTTAGKAKVSGVYKLSICSADQCQIEEPKLELNVPAS